MEEAAFDPSSYDPSRPAAFYLGDEDLAEYTDSVRVVQGAELPVSAIVVVQRSAVLRGAYRAERESVALQATAPGGRKRTRQATAAAEARPPRVRLTIEGCSVKEAAIFLRFLYHTHEITPAAMGKLGADLPGVARLAHKYDVPVVLAAAEAWLTTPDAAQDPKQVLVSLQLATELQLDRLRAHALLAAATQLVGSSATHSTAGILEAAQVPEGNSWLLLGALAAAVKQAPEGARQQVLAKLPAASELESWLCLNKQAGGVFVWDIEGFSGLDQPVSSPEFSIGGLDWELECYPKGDSEYNSEGYLSVCLQLALHSSDPGAFAATRFTVVNQRSPADSVSWATSVNHYQKSGWGCDKLISVARLTDPAAGFLVRDRLRLKVEVAC